MPQVAEKAFFASPESSDDNDTEANVSRRSTVDLSFKTYLTIKKLQTPASPQQTDLLETPDLIIALDNSSDDNRQIAAGIIKKANEFFRLGGCLDELRISVFQVS